MNLVDRAVKMLTTPKTEWDAVVAEPAASQQILVGYVVPMTLLAHLAAFIGSAFVGAMFSAFLGLHRTLTFWLASAVLGWLMSLVLVYVEAAVVNALAPTFGSTKSSLNAFKLVVFASTAAWVGGLLAIIPILGWLGALAGAVYSIYLFYLGLPKLMATPPDKVVAYMLVAALVIIVLWCLASFLVGAVATAMFGAMTLVP
ncbi:MAG TPA: Yip1 family protein [Candidatus Saccharimonadales bacterium]|nr:Yip1 family protein [Candidatus Saccharimonadales bacterium]